jgi:hypothetical protein
VSTATGHLRYGPQSHTLKRRSGWWLLIICDRDWYEHYAPLARREISPEWVMAVDRRRATESADPDPRLAVCRPWLCEPAWAPHICCVRRERPKRHLDVWNLGIEVGDLMDEEVHLIESAKYLRAKADNLRAEIAHTDGTQRVKAKRIKRMEAELQDALRVADLRDKDLPRVRRNMRRLQRQWLQLAAEKGVPVAFEPGAEIEFWFDPSPRTNGKHWWFDVKCQALHDVRVAYGLRPTVYPAPHLTFAVKEGLEDKEPD